MNPRVAIRRDQAQSTSSGAPVVTWRSWLVWGIAALFYLTGFYQRVSPAVMTSELMRDFGLGAKSLGSFSAFYFYFYVAMQVPVGVLIDSWGARKLLFWGALSAAAGTFLFGATSNFALACAGRAIVGGATAAGWLVLLKLATHWFPARRFAMLSGLGLFFGNVGALFAQVPLRLLIERFGWRNVVLCSSVILVGVCVAVWLAVQNDPSEAGLESHAPAVLRTERRTMRALGAGFRKVFAYRNTWFIFFAQGGIVGPILAFTGLWGTPFLAVRYGLPPARAAAVCSVMIVCWAVASPISGALSDRIGRRKPLYLLGAMGSAAGWIVMFYVNSLPLALFIAVAALTSFASGAVVLGFAYAKESVPVEFLGTISGAINIGNMIGPMLLQPGIGQMLDRNWAGQMTKGVRLYDLQAYRAAFVLVVCWAVASCVLIAVTTETFCRPRA
ncbi:MAG: MFS transporter [Candidatus Sulfopaludibacter sp.]|nr:MFS transporter [Candidatus Sulfopaludibacter sp.]